MTSSSQQLHVVHVITGLHTGGAEMMLYKVLAAMDPARFSAEVISLSDGGEVRSLIEALGIPVRSLGLTPSVAWAPRALVDLWSMLRASPAAVVQTWMYHADLLGGLAARLAGHRAVCWDIQGSNLDPVTTRWKTRAIVRACAALSGRLPARIICCGHTTRQIHVDLGYAADRIVVIPNAVDVSRFVPNPAARADVRRELGVPDPTLLVGMAARYDPQKDHRTLVDAIGLAAKTRGVEAHVLLFGKDLTPANRELRESIEAAGVAATVHLLGLRSDVARLLAACDVSVLSSAYGEGLPNAVVEAMACAVPCVATDVGDTRWVIDDTGRVVPPRDPGALAAALSDVLALPAADRQALGVRARARVAEHFEIRAVADRYHALYESVASGRP